MKKLLILSGILLALFMTVRAADQKAYLGLSVMIIEDDDPDTPEGVIIDDVYEDTGAQKAGLKAGDHLVAIDGVTVKDLKDLHNTLKAYLPGDTVQVVVIREGREMSFAVDLGEHKAGSRLVKPFDGNKWVILINEDRAYLGIHTLPLSEQLAEYFNVESGVMITEVLADSPAQAAGLRAGDIILRWSDEAIVSTRDLLKRLGKAKEGDDIEFLIQRRDRQFSIPVTLGKTKDNDGVFHLHEGIALPNIRLELKEVLEGGHQIDIQHIVEDIDLEHLEEIEEALKDTSIIIKKKNEKEKEPLK
ncbi:MAG: PDZ domain-containing protein [Acidobacteria bacterium]|nr:PDZ domain-containing protein [Acidobacteriota bacterium]